MTHDHNRTTEHGDVGGNGAVVTIMGNIMGITVGVIVVIIVVYLPMFL